jgi:hypothetical protein
MKPAPLGALNADLAPIEEDLAARIDAIFERCPQLFGFTVQDSTALPEELRSFALLDFLLERPGGKDALRGRTFARSLH